MEGEVGNFIQAWCTALVSLAYCHASAKVTPNGIIRLLTFFPVLILFFLLPLHLSSIYLRANTAFFLTWLANFKLLLFAFGDGPLAASPLSLPHFLVLASLPIQLRPHGTTKKKVHQRLSLWVLNRIIKTAILVLLYPLYDYTEGVHPYILLVLYSLHLYLSLEVSMEAVAAIVKLFFGTQLAPPFNEPYLSTSLQDFWSRRWNLVVSNVLRPTVFVPVLRLSSPIVGRKWAPVPAVFFTFLVSALMHELMYFYICGQRPTWEVTFFFVLHGICMAVELVLKKLLPSNFRIPRAVSSPLTISFLGVTAFWLFFPQMIRCNAILRTVTEVTEFSAFVRKSLSSLFKRNLNLTAGLSGGKMGLSHFPR